MLFIPSTRKIEVFPFMRPLIICIYTNFHNSCRVNVFLVLQFCVLGGNSVEGCDIPCDVATYNDGKPGANF